MAGLPTLITKRVRLTLEARDVTNGVSIPSQVQPRAPGLRRRRDSGEGVHRAHHAVEKCLNLRHPALSGPTQALERADCVPHLSYRGRSHDQAVDRKALKNSA